MLLLAIDTSGKQGSIALARGHEAAVEILEIVSLTGGMFSAQLIPQIAELLSKRALTKNQIDAFLVAAGPGSFTGLRIGLAAVKGLAEILNKPIVSVSLLEACAFESRLQGKVMTALDAGRGDVYVGESLIPAAPEHAKDQSAKEAMLTRSEFLTQGRGWTIATPDPTLAATASAAGLLVHALPRIDAAAIARLGWRKLQRGKTVTPQALEANYIRRTDAEMLEKIRS